jgi:hypothetical protein
MAEREPVSALIDTSVVLVTTRWVRDCNGEKFPLREERQTVRCLVWDPCALAYTDMLHLLALTIANKEAIAAS